MSEWSSFQREKLIADAWRSYLKEGAPAQISEGYADITKRLTGKLEKDCKEKCCGPGTKFDDHVTKQDDEGNVTIVTKGTFRCIPIADWKKKRGEEEETPDTEPTPAEVGEEEPIHVFRTGGSQNDSLVNILGVFGLQNWARGHWQRGLDKNLKQMILLLKKVELKSDQNKWVL